ncbi:hypothetical protein BSL82_15670 [Tardibacter chloracetimidivorans]|uniref:Uncharacterized protein n=1 Tax=Tardibacter chloracetimidivorans TaxID=1921510 RepID=A0A1L3ZY29_9SPHN|nr:hypothetical protein [Tardibacter chloracetimidivorans]API60543.1 hypothetical protein BSL82_15670 [Tardibacter chloracetimidivorans]
MNGTMMNWLKHAALAALITVVFGLAFSPVAGWTIALVFFWAKEAGEKSKDWSAPGRPWSDWNPFSRRWEQDDVLDLASAIFGASAALLVWALC